MHTLASPLTKSYGHQNLRTGDWEAWGFQDDEVSHLEQMDRTREGMGRVAPQYELYPRVHHDPLECLQLWVSRLVLGMAFLQQERRTGEYASAKADLKEGNGKRPLRDKVVTPDQFPSQAMRLWGRCAPALGSHAVVISSCALVTKPSWFGRFGRKCSLAGGRGRSRG